MNDVILKLIKLVTKATTATATRDLHYQIVLDYNGGHPLWFIEHDGKEWQMETFCKPSRNGFKTFKQAESVLEEVLLKVAAEAIKHQRALALDEPDRIPEPEITELEIQYLALEIAS